MLQYKLLSLNQVTNERAMPQYTSFDQNRSPLPKVSSYYNMKGVCNLLQRMSML